MHRVAHFLQHHHTLLTQILSGVDHTPQQLLLLYMGLTHASALLAKDAPATLAAETAPAVVAARAAIAQYNATADDCQRAAKAAILDARISAARSAAWNKDVAACTVKAAVSKVPACLPPWRRPPLHLVYLFVSWHAAAFWCLCLSVLASSAEARRCPTCTCTDAHSHAGLP